VPTGKQLDGWKQIGDYLGVHHRTAQRLAEQHGLPVVGGGRKIAFTDVLDLWRANGRRRLEPQSATLSGNVLTAYIDDLPLWTHAFKEPPSAAAGDLIVHMDTGGDGAHFGYHFSEDLEPTYVFPSRSHEFRHQSLEREGKITHPWSACPEVRAPLTLRIWEPGSGWRDRQVPWRDTYPQGY